MKRQTPDKGSDGACSYLRFATMIATSTVVMLALMYFTVWEGGHVWWSQTKGYMALYMGGAMALVMLGFMLGMYRDKAKNLTIVAIALAAFLGGLFLMRFQTTVEDVAWMKGMIPHHSLAILTSKRAALSDSRVRKLAGDIIKVQRAEIAEMEFYIRDIEANGDAPAGAGRRKFEAKEE